MNLPFHLVAALGLALALACVTLHRSTLAAVLAAVGYLVAGVVAALGLHRGSFEILGLGAWGIFFYGALYAVGVALLLARVPRRPERWTAMAAALCAVVLAGLRPDAQ
jgi:uncharacterized BrkB/YihY/UPF0761 family membrane protein